MGMKVSGRNRKNNGHPYSRVIGVVAGTGTPVFPVDLTEMSIQPQPTTTSTGQVGSPATGSRHASTGIIISAGTGGTLVWKDSAGISSTLVIGTGLTPLPFAMSEITSFAGATASIVVYWDD